MRWPYWSAKPLRSSRSLQTHECDASDDSPWVPGTVLARRPDVASAQRQLLAAQKRVGVAQSAWFPDLQLTAAAVSGRRVFRFSCSVRSQLGLGALLSLRSRWRQARRRHRFRTQPRWTRFAGYREQVLRRLPRRRGPALRVATSGRTGACSGNCRELCEPGPQPCRHRATATASSASWNSSTHSAAS
jgi:hypothetical protein